MILTSNHSIWLKYESLIRNVTFPGESGEKSAQIKHRLQIKTVQNSKDVCGIWCERQQEMEFLLEEVLLWSRAEDLCLNPMGSVGSV